ncbi:MAG: DUF2079 domain-containing protein, partial [Thermoguttaceae bacterium]
MLAGVGWWWAAGLLANREHWAVTCVVIPTAPPAWGVVALPPGVALLLALAAVGLTWGAFWADSASGHRVVGRATRWLLLGWIIPLVSLLRLAEVPIGRTFFEPLLLAGITGAACRGIASSIERQVGGLPGRWPGLAPALVLVMTAASCGWWLFQGLGAYDDYLFGYCDFAQYGWRLANTWAGRGFMMETPGLSAFWDHFCPAVALLAPIWGMTQDVRLFMVLQALCLSLPAVFIYLLVRRWGGSGGTGCLWAAAYLVFPAVGQLNLNYSYGWHPVSVAMLLFMTAILALAAGRRTTAAVLAVFACTWQDYVAVNLGWFALVMAVFAWRNQRNGGRRPSWGSADVRIADALPPWGWLLTAGAAGAYFFAIYHVAPFSHEETARFGNLGDTAGEILLSPLLRPEAFWGNVLRYRSVVFLLALAVPLDLGNLYRGWKTLVGAALPLGVLVAWDFQPATSIAFQYHTLTLPVFFLAAISGAAASGAAAGRGKSPRPEGAGRPAGARESSDGRGLWTGGAAALAASLTASLTLGVMPWSCPTTTGLVLMTYPGEVSGSHRFDNRRSGSVGNAALDRIVGQVGQEDATVLASGRIAAHLLGVERLEP